MVVKYRKNRQKIGILSSNDIEDQEDENIRRIKNEKGK